MEPATLERARPARAADAAAAAPAAGDADVLLVVNGGLTDVEVTLPRRGPAARLWELVWDSAWDAPEVPDDEAGPRTSVTLDALNIHVLLSPGG